MTTHILNEYGFTEGEARDLEVLIDRRGIEQLLQQLCEICQAKAEHFEHMWQDTIVAKQWATVAGSLGVASTKATGL